MNASPNYARHFVLQVAAAIFPMAFCSSVIPIFANAAASAPSIWVLHDGDPDYVHPTIGDTLTGMFADGQVGVAVTGLNIDQTVGGQHAISVVQSDHSVIVAEDVGGFVRKYNAQGTPVWSVKVGTTPLSVGLASDGTVYALYGGTIYGDAITRISKDGVVSGQISSGGFDLAIDDARQSMYVVGASIKYLGFDLSERWSIDPIEWTAVSVDVGNDGSGWIAERFHPQVDGSLNRLLHVSPSGTILGVVNLDTDPFCVSVDGFDNSVYAAVGEMLKKFNSQGQEIYSKPLGSLGWSLALDENRDVWVGTWSNVLKFHPDGTGMQTLMTFSTPSDTWIAVPHLAIPEPASIFSAAAALGVIMLRRRRRRHSA